MHVDARYHMPERAGWRGMLATDNTTSLMAESGRRIRCASAGVCPDGPEESFDVKKKAPLEQNQVVVIIKLYSLKETAIPTRQKWKDTCR